MKSRLLTSRYGLLFIRFHTLLYFISGLMCWWRRRLIGLPLSVRPSVRTVLHVSKTYNKVIQTCRRVVHHESFCTCGLFLATLIKTRVMVTLFIYMCIISICLPCYPVSHVPNGMITTGWVTLYWPLCIGVHILRLSRLELWPLMCFSIFHSACNRASCKNIHKWATF